ncbi:dUTP diphosphatase [Geobacillus phage vB_GthS_PK2.1]|nr:dUTP diphosphatase [Geobacillus phage vB_GthS_PK2.1]
MVKVDERTIDLSELFQKQQMLTDYVWKKHNITKANMQKEKAAIICELWETANELKSDGFKYWTDKKCDRGKTLEEIVDMLHFYLQIGNIMGVVYEHHWIEKHDTILDQIMAINWSLLTMDGPLMWALSFAQYRGLVRMLGFDWDQDIIPAYDRKFQENIVRQKRGY